MASQSKLQEPVRENARTVRVAIDGEEAIGRLHLAEKSTVGGLVCVGGVAGGFSGPASIYPDLCRHLQPLGIAGLRLDYRHADDFRSCVLDTLEAVQFLHRELHIHRTLLVGHSLGGAVIITAAALEPKVVGAAAIATQTYGTDAVDHISPKPLLLIHGTEDPVLPASCSHHVFRRAREPKELKLIPGAGHCLEETREELLALLQDWVRRQFAGGV